MKQIKFTLKNKLKVILVPSHKSPVVSVQMWVKNGSADEQKFWRDAMLGNRVSNEDLAHATALLREHGAIEDTIDRARHYGQRAIDAIAHFPGGEAKAALTEAVEFAISRAY